MDRRVQCAAVIPCLNEAATIGPLVEGVRRFVATVFVIDDGSTDETAVIARKAGAHVLADKSTNGKGAALTRGWRRAQESGFAWALTLDGDGQHSPDDIPAFFRCAETTGAALVVGNRMAQADRMPWARRATNRWMSRQLSELSGRLLADTQCGFRLFDLDAWTKLSVTSQHFEIESELLIAFLAAGLKVEFVPIRAIYKTEQSKIHPWRDTVRWFQWWRQERRKRSKHEARMSKTKGRLQY